MSVSALARAASASRTWFYRHFSSPEDLAIHAASSRRADRRRLFW
jgi:AcrR family transcriptional regulator